MIINECKGKQFDWSETSYVSYLTDLGKLLEGRHELLNDIAIEIENHKCAPSQNCYHEAEVILKGNFAFNNIKSYIENHKKLFENTYYKFHNLEFEDTQFMSEKQTDFIRSVSFMTIRFRTKKTSQIKLQSLKTREWGSKTIMKNHLWIFKFSQSIFHREFMSSSLEYWDSRIRLKF